MYEISQGGKHEVIPAFYWFQFETLLTSISSCMKVKRQKLIGSRIAARWRKILLSLTCVALPSLPKKKCAYFFIEFEMCQPQWAMLTTSLLGECRHCLMKVVGWPALVRVCPSRRPSHPRSTLLNNTSKMFSGAVKYKWLKFQWIILFSSIFFV